MNECEEDSKNGETCYNCSCKKPMGISNPLEVI